MKTFSQFLNESYLREEEAVQGRLLNRKNQAYKDINNPNTGNRGYATDPTPIPASRRLPAGAPEAPKASSGQLEIPEPKTTKVPSPALPASPQTTNGGQLANVSKSEALVKTSGSNIATRPSTPVVDTSIKPVDVKVLNTDPKALPSGSGSGGGPKSPSGSGSGGGPKSPSSKTEVPGKLGKFGKVLGPIATAVDTALSTADERAKGSGWARSLAKGATVAAGGLLGGTAGAIGGGGLLSAATGTAGAMAGGAAAEKAFDTVAGANAKERKAIATANRKSQSGGEIKGIGGPTSFSQKKPGGAAFISTGSGPQRKTVELAKTSVVTDPKSGKQEVGNLAFKGGKAVYKRADTKSLAQTSSNPFERIGRTIAAGAYKANDAKLAAAKLATARASDASRNQKLGVKLKPGG